MSLTSAIWIALLLILFASILVTLLTYLYIESVIKKSKKETTNYSEKFKENEVSKENIEPRIFIEAQEVQSDGVLATSSAIIGVISLEVFARRHQPDYVVGVNRGGWLLSTYLAHRLNISRKNLLRFDADRNQIIEDINLLDEIHNTNKEVNVLLVDDISRTGHSIQKAVDCLKSQLTSVSISVGVLIVCGRNTDENVDYNPYWTQYKDIQLPWSSDERKKEARKIINAQENVALLGDQSSLDTKVPVLRIADSETKEGEGVDISISDIEIAMNILQERFIHIPATR
jgi:hypoxanthine phosphoribosyltransferase